MNAFDFVTVTVEGHVATVLMDRPPVNAMNAALFSELTRVFADFDERLDVGAVVLASANDRAFLAGLDLRQDKAPELSPTGRMDPGRIARECFSAVRHCAVPVVAAVDGPALGGGLAVAASCDVILASERAEFGLPEIDLGLLGGGAHLLRMVGPYRMRQAFFTAERIPAAELYRLGCVARLVPSEQLVAEARALAATMAAKSPIAVRLAKQALNRSEGLPTEDAYWIEQDYTARLVHSEDSREARRAYRDQRTPEFHGR